MKKKYSNAAQKKIAYVMDEWKKGKLHSGSKKGPKVTSPKQAIAIGISEAKKRGLKISTRKPQNEKSLRKNKYK